MKKIGIALIGAGTVGQGVLKILNSSSELIQKRTGVELNLIGVCDKNPKVLEHYPQYQLCSNYTDLIKREDVNIVVELIGGTDFAYQVVKDALRYKKTVVTANKALLSEKGHELFALAKEKEVEIGYEAAVGGAIPIIRSLKSSLISNEFQAIYGILNGTTNFILSKMEQENLNYLEALRLAQELGFAERDPTFDVEGIDAAHKVSLLASLAFGYSVSIKDMYVEGITKISKTEIFFAKELGYRIKLLGICSKEANGIEARVQPTMVPIHHPIAGVMNEMNAVYVYSNYSGPMMFFGKGAGSLPTASAVISDLVYYGSRIGSETGFENNLFHRVKIIPTSEIEEKFYLRFNTYDRPGVIAYIANILGKNKISISSVRQEETKKEPAEVIFLTHKTKEKSVRKAIEEIDKNREYILQPTIMMRIEELT